MKNTLKIIIALFLIGIFVAFCLSLIASSNRRQLGIEIQTKQTLSRLKQLHRSLEEFKDDTGFYPKSTNELSYLLSDHGIQNWNGPYYPRKVLHTDSWGKPFHYDLIDKKPFLVSSGPDEKLGTKDDIKTEK